VESHVVLSRYAARNVVRQVALMLLDGVALTSERFKEIVTAMKEGMELRGGSYFIPFGWLWRGGQGKVNLTA